ncbi:MAG: hypothetical protein R6U11_03205 [Bacteroidales bacterium]
MKKLLLFCSLLLLSLSYSSAQDIIIKTDGNEIQSKVVEITGETIKYKEFEYLDGPIKNINISQVFMIIYENGRRETFTPLESTVEEQPEEETETETETQEPEEEVVLQKELPRGYKGNYFMLATGFGNSYGGLGIRLQFRAGGNVGFGFHFGGGIDFAEGVKAAAGLKFYPYRGLYLNTQFGILGYHDDFYIDHNILIGPSALIGGDWSWGKTVGVGFNLAAGASYILNTPYEYDLLPAFDIGFVLRF